MNKSLIIIIIILVAFIFRLVLLPYGMHHDLLTNAGWGKWMYENGTSGFYENNIWTYSWPTQLPLINLIYKFNFDLYKQITWYFSYVSAVISTHQFYPQLFSWLINFTSWFGGKLYLETPYVNGFLISMKLIPVLADLLIGLVIYLFSKRLGMWKAVVLSSLYLFLPFSWYISSLWGQYDQLAVLLLIGSFLLLYKRFFILSSILLFAALQIKPTTLYLLPFYGLYYLVQKPNPLHILLSTVLAVGTYFVTVIPFTDKNPFTYTWEIILPKVFFVERFEGLVNRAFNFWQLFYPQGGRAWHSFLGLSFSFWGYLSLALIYLQTTLIILKNNNLKAIFTCLFLISGGSFLFGTGMMDRYFFTTAAILPIMISYYPSLSRWFLLSLILFSYNLFYSWGFPLIEFPDTWHNNLLIRILSLMQVVTFIVLIVKMKLIQPLYSEYIKPRIGNSFLKI